MSDGLTAADVVRRLGLSAHPEGGWFVETFRDPVLTGGRAASTAIYYLLEAGQSSRWHRVKDAAEVWHHYAGAPLRLRLAQGQGESSQELVLGTDLGAGQRPQIVCPSGVWQTAVSLGEWSLCGCTVAPGFDFSSFEIAPPGWRPD